MILPRASLRPIVTTTSGRCPVVTSATESSVMSAWSMNPCTASMVASATRSKGDTVAVRPVATPIRWVVLLLSWTCARVTSARGSQFTASNFSLAFIVPPGAQTSAAHPPGILEARFMPWHFARMNVGKLGGRQQRKAPQHFAGRPAMIFRTLVVASPRDAGVQQILVCLQPCVQPHEWGRNPSTEEHDGEEDRGVNPQTLRQVPEGPQEQRPPVDVQPGGQGLVVQRGQGIFFPDDANL